MHVFPLHHRVMFSGDQNILITPTALNPIIDVGATWIITVTPQQNNQMYNAISDYAGKYNFLFIIFYITVYAW